MCTPKKFRKTPIVSLCKACGKPLTNYPSRQPKVFCDRTCQRRWESEQYITKICPGCHKPFQVKPARDYRIFCTQDCYLAMLERGGEAHPSWKGGRDHYYGQNWQEQAEAARQRDHYTCQHCGQKQEDYYRALDVHHIKPFKLFGIARYLEANRLENLITLCSSCHIQLEYGKISLNLQKAAVSA